MMIARIEEEEEWLAGLKAQLIGQEEESVNRKREERVHHLR